MKKVILLLIIAVICILAVLLVRKRRNDNRNFAGSTLPEVSKDGEHHGSQVDLILNKDETLLSYSILVKNMEKSVENVHFTVGGERVKQISGPRSYQKGANDMILHGLWRDTDSKPLSAERVEQLKTGQITVTIETKEGQLLEIPIRGSM